VLDFEKLLAGDSENDLGMLPTVSLFDSLYMTSRRCY